MGGTPIQSQAQAALPRQTVLALDGLAPAGRTYLFLSLYNLKYICGTSLYTDSAGNALGRICRTLWHNHNTERTCFHTLSAAYAKLLVNHVNTLSILLDRTMFAGLRTLSTLHTYRGLYRSLFLPDLNTGLSRIKFLIKSFGACNLTAKTCHTFTALFHSQFFHNEVPPIVFS